MSKPQTGQKSELTFSVAAGYQSFKRFCDRKQHFWSLNTLLFIAASIMIRGPLSVFFPLGGDLLRIKSDTRMSVRVNAAQEEGLGLHRFSSLLKVKRDLSRFGSKVDVQCSA